MHTIHRYIDTRIYARRCVIGFDSNNPSGFYHLDLSDPKDREICTLLLAEAKKTSRDFFRNGAPCVRCNRVCVCVCVCVPMF